MPARQGSQLRKSTDNLGFNIFSFFTFNKCFVDMVIENISPQSFNWESIIAERVEGETGYTLIKTQSAGSIKIRQVEYSANYLADHWCDKGHVVCVISGQLTIEHKDGSEHELSSGSTYVVGDNSMAHRAKSVAGVLVLIVD
jgi:hypothetical protein